MVWFISGFCLNLIFFIHWSFDASVNRLEVLTLFRTLIGDIRTSQDSEDALEITFFTADSARKALCMAGYNIAGSALFVSPVVRAGSPVSSHGASQGKRNDTRRNLYVLGIPFGMTNQSLAALFAPHGTVSHCVILATLDSASRRRGFVVMSTHEEARRAMAALGRGSKGGSGMDISWAVVQRSKGFLDGGDRAGIVNPLAPSLTPPPSHDSQLPPSDTSALPSLSSVPTSTLLLANLPSLLFKSEDDLRGLICPFGNVKLLRIVHLTVSTPPSTAAIAQYASLTAAQEAHRALDGESYAGCTVRAAYLVEHETEPASAPASPLPQTPVFPAQLNFPPARSSSFTIGPRCGLPGHKSSFDGRNVGNQILGGAGYGYGHSGRHWRSPELMQQQIYVAPPFPQFESSPAYGVNEFPQQSVLFPPFRSSALTLRDLLTRWIPDPMYLRAPLLRDMGYYV
ncbi:RRM domain-containing protein [Mycena sanguinolenta]|uniref:RRM domain-containing protein n=1 Tax=Mycena sanguinolenta TaxID=230812 RepID=A0A8H6Y3P4_9AGAR|nr:RRM domain-containing protein [Mycena sanguinolenta]